MKIVGCDNRGKYFWSNEHKKKMSGIKKGYKPTDETKKKLSKKIKWMHDHDEVYQKKCRETNYKKGMPGKKNPMFGKKRPDVSKRNKENPMKGKKNPAWIGGKSFEPYGFEFNKQLKATIKERDSHTCTMCGLKETIFIKHSVHHIDYDKKNNNPNNLITLCSSCHGKTNLRREMWTRSFKIWVEKLYG